MERVATGPSVAGPPGRTAAPATTMVLFGAGGDLTRRLLFPALYNLSVDGLLPDGFRLLGLDVEPVTGEAWKAELARTLHAFAADSVAEFHPDHIDAAALDRLLRCASFQRADFTDEAAFRALATDLGSGSALFYLAVPARFFGGIADRLAGAGLFAESDGAFRRLVIEKPFGADLASARALNAGLLRCAREDQLFRIDHFMGKEPVQSILAMRFGNRIFEPLLNATHVASVEITAAETLGVEGRGRFYEPTGALRDMVPNHLFQLLCMAAMDAPPTLAPEDVRGEKTCLLRAVRPADPGDAVFGQYDAGRIDGVALPAYRAEPDVAPDSGTETYAALRLRVENWRWSGTPFFLRTGKRLRARRTEIVYRFRPTPTRLFAEAGIGGDTADTLVLGIDPDHGVEMRFDVKRPGEAMALAPATMRFSFAEAFAEAPNVGYEVLLYDAMRGDATLFQRADTIEAAWAVVDPLLTGARPAVMPYAAGSDGPSPAAALVPDGWNPLG